MIVPLGDWRNAAGVGFGGFATWSFVSWDEWRLQVRAGYIGHLSVSGSGDQGQSGAGLRRVRGWQDTVDEWDNLKKSVFEIPVLVGFQTTFDTFYIGLELGPVLNRTSLSTMGDVIDNYDSWTKIRAGGTLGIGFFDLFGYLDVGVSVISTNI